jgi:hypothetical protein
MTKLPAFQFYPGDWMKAPEIRALSLSARGLWFDMICYMHQSTKYGHFIIGDSVPTSDEAARIIGCEVAEYERLLSELEKFNVFSRTKSGTIFCRRMVRDAVKRKEWNARQKRHRDQIAKKIKQDTERDVTQIVTHGVTPLSRLSSSSSSIKDNNIAKAISDKREIPVCPHTAIIDLYHRILHRHPRVMTVTNNGTKKYNWKGDRMARLAARWKESEERQTLEWWEGFFKHIDESDFLTGRKKDFICDLDWILTFKNFEKIRAGNYHRN